ncbi:hypothetical protein [Tenggerimyces flavus]|uniref:Uncharacterized protein n=1 Tax=Tenggerimyces flavus TaxID=1708749 RepID=A0ABV7YNG2_9ACTN|nr:hypothetical protein [Tenggerimyces flavus]MBM7787780.1 hypothetical protein [Tenggerimyces flavus]
MTAEQLRQAYAALDSHDAKLTAIALEFGVPVVARQRERAARIRVELDAISKGGTS